MKTPSCAQLLIAIAAAAVLSVLASAPASAQGYGNAGVPAQDYGKANPAPAREQGHTRSDAQPNTRQPAADAEADQAPKSFPKATRVEPKGKASRHGFEALQKLQTAFEAGDYANTLAQANALAANDKSNAYEKSVARQIAGTAAAQNNDNTKAARYFERALASNGLDNQHHYEMMYDLIAIQSGLKQYDNAFKTLNRFLTETRDSTPNLLNLRGGLLLELRRYGEAAAQYQQLMAKYPNDGRYLTNAAAAYQKGGEDDKAVALLAQAQARGALTEPAQYRVLYRTYVNADKTSEAIKVIDDGIAKGMLKPGPDLAKDYMVLGQNAYSAKDNATAIEMYQRAASMTSDGEAALNLAKIHANNGNTAEAKAAAQRALDQGVKDTAAAKRLAGTGG